MFFIRPHWLENRASVYARLCRELERAGLEPKVLQQSKQELYDLFFPVE